MPEGSLSHIAVAIIGAVGPTLAAVGAWRHSRRASHQVQSSNGKTTAQMVESLTRSTSRIEDRLDLLFEMHSVPGRHPEA